MSDSAAADRFMRLIEKRVDAMIETRLRAKTGVIPGGPYGSFTVDSQGRITSAGGAGAYSAVLLWEDDTTGTTVLDDTVAAVLWSMTNTDYGVYSYDTDGYWSSGAPTRIVFPADGYYDIVAMISWDTSGVGSRVIALQYLDTGGTGVTEISRSYVTPFAPPRAPNQLAAAQGWYAQAGYQLEVTVDQNSGSTLVLGGISSLSVRRVG